MFPPLFLTACRLAGLSALVLASSVPTAAAANDTENLANPIGRWSLKSLSGSRERPLFSPGRRPPAPPPPPAVVVAEPPAPIPSPVIALYGIITDDNGTRAVLRPSPTEKITRVRLGDDVGGWKVSLIEARRLVLSHNDRTATFTLFTNGRFNRDDAGSEEPRRRRRRSSD
jgi:general secretion pathway protein N